ncbi:MULTISPECIES: hypothetical protein [Bacillaceae]|uniref:Uncharacterized protein n=2 Tax=Bacillaceae TaxID=186817 RepID=A0A9D5DS39_9BACI|nr:MULTISPECIES: hypothetical protein [Bacillaceae]KQL57703.1 hypothetical protein AN965_09560 [Alkalicoccobacillus plakortidis]MBG9784128.1 hypothetical protein [Shouchella lehensis]RQW20861.1 hypothetical protein EH196_12335 [Bacillus sp. C1-1]TES50885.1 hypothetical protein E2L03_02850 [Shouchella lehensis]
MKVAIINGQSKKADGLTAYLQMTYPFISVYSLETMSVHDLNQNNGTHLVFIIPAKKSPYLHLKRLFRGLKSDHQPSITLITTEGTDAHHSIIQMFVRDHVRYCTHIQLPEHLVHLRGDGQVIQQRKLLKRLLPLQQMLYTELDEKTVS